MIEYDPGKPLFSLHIPKCAGTAFIEILKSWYGTKLYLHYIDEKNNKNPKIYRLKKYIKNEYRKNICIHGHFNRNRYIGVREYYPDADQFITFFRDPFERFLSNYYFMKRKTGGRNRGSSGGIYRAGRIVDRSIDPDYTLEQHFKKIMGKTSQYFPDDMNLNNFKDYLNSNFIYIGLAEDMQTSVDKLSEKLGFKSKKVPHKNKSTREDQHEYELEDLREDFINRNILDWEIYQYVKSNYKNW